MSVHWVCRLCIALYGLKGADAHLWPMENDVEGIARHMRNKHHLDLVDANKVDWSTDKCDCADCRKTKDLRLLLIGLGAFDPVKVDVVPRQ